MGRGSVLIRDAKTADETQGAARDTEGWGICFVNFVLFVAEKRLATRPSHKASSFGASADETAGMQAGAYDSNERSEWQMLKTGGRLVRWVGMLYRHEW